MREEKQFVRWMAFIAFMIFGVGKGIPVALIMWVPEPLPKLAPATELAILNAWTYPGERVQQDLLTDLDHLETNLRIDAELEMFGIPPDTKCGGLQWDYDVVMAHLTGG